MNEWIRWRQETFFTKEPETIVWLKNLVPGRVFWDVGANIGIYSAFAVSRGLEVHAFEPDKKNYNILCQIPGIKSYYIALGAENKRETFLSVPEAGMSGGRLGAGDDKILVVRGDGLGLKCDYLKIDTDGGEYQILQGMGDLLSKVRGVLIEINEDWFEIFRILKYYGLKERISYQSFKTRNMAHNYIFGR